MKLFTRANNSSRSTNINWISSLVPAPKLINESADGTFKRITDTLRREAADRKVSNLRHVSAPVEVAPSRDGGELIRSLPRVSDCSGLEVYALFGSGLPTGSHKVISALGLIDSALRRDPDAESLLLSSSGNTCPACVWVLQKRGYKKRLLCVVDPRLEREKREKMEALGVSLLFVESPSLSARLAMVKEISQHIGVAYVDQYCDPAGLEAQRRITGPWIERTLGCDLHAIFVPVGTGSCLGLPLHLQSVSPHLHTFAVDPEGSGTFASHGTRIITGAGAEFITPVTLSAIKRLKRLEVVTPTNQAAVSSAWWLRQNEREFVGGSSGLVLAAFAAVFRRLPPRAKVLLVFPDGGKAYNETIYSREWLDSRGVSNDEDLF